MSKQSRLNKAKADLEPAQFGKAVALHLAGKTDQAEALYRKLLARVWQLHEKGLCAAVYTQTTDVETECNGMMTYDRTVKGDLAQIAAANRGDVPQAHLLEMG